VRAPDISLDQHGLALRLWRGWLEPDARRAMRDHLEAAIRWEQPLVRVYGRQHRVPRLVAWVGDAGCSYRYSGHRHHPLPWTAELDELRDRLERSLGLRFNSLLLNRYRDGLDRMGWHADDEPELECHHPIASLSLGASRDLRFRPRHAPASADRGREGVAHEASTAAAPFALNLADGDLLLMNPPTQQHWLHALPTRRRVPGARLNLTFRRLRHS